MYTCPVAANRTILDDYIVKFNADSDIAGIGVISSFFIGAWVTVLLLAVTYLMSAPDQSDNIGFSKLDMLVVGGFQKLLKRSFSKFTRREINPRAGPKTIDAFQKAILILSDQQLITGAGISIVGLARLRDITQYHFNIAMNLSLAALVAHSMIFRFVEQYIGRNVFFRTWRSIAMILFGSLLLGSWAVTGSNDWLSVYGLPALCGYKNLGQNFAPPAIVRLAILYWILLRGWACALAVLFPDILQLHWIVVALSTASWLRSIFEAIQKVCKLGSRHLCHQLKMLQDNSQVLSKSKHSSLSTTTTQFNRWLNIVFWIVVCSSSLFFATLVYGLAQVWASFAFGLCWTCYTLVGSVQIIAAYRSTAALNGMIGSENQWSFGQQLPLLMLALPVLAVLELFFGTTVFRMSLNFANLV